MYTEFHVMLNGDLVLYLGELIWMAGRGGRLSPDCCGDRRHWSL